MFRLLAHPRAQTWIYEAARESAGCKEDPSGARPVNQTELGGACVKWTEQCTVMDSNEVNAFHFCTYVHFP